MRTGWLATVMRLPFNRTKPAAVRAAAAGRVRTIRACHSHLSIRWRSSSWVQVLKTGLCHSVPASALAQRAWQTANSGPVCRGRRQCCRKALRNTAPVRHDQPADRDHGVAARRARRVALFPLRAFILTLHALLALSPVLAFFSIRTIAVLIAWPARAACRLTAVGRGGRCRTFGRRNDRRSA